MPAGGKTFGKISNVYTRRSSKPIYECHKTKIAFKNCYTLKAMETSLKLQMDIKNNAQDLENYVMDLKNWEEEVKKKEMELNCQKSCGSNIPPPRNKIKSKPENEKKSSNKSEKISAYDYSAWDKFDVDKACAEVDSEEISEKESEQELELEVNQKEGIEVTEKAESDKKRLLQIDEAFYEKQLGNQFVKKEQWNSAIKCYTNSINLDPNNPIYYANRSLCFLKLKNFKSAEVDATVAIQLDKTYVKAFQRRAIARLALGQLGEAKSDYEEVLKIEPKNLLAKTEINKIDQRLSKESKISKNTQPKVIFNPKEIFKSEESKLKTSNISDSLKRKPVTSEKLQVMLKNDKKDKIKNEITINEGGNLSTEKAGKSLDEGNKSKTLIQLSNKSNVTAFKPLPEWCTIVHPIQIPPHKRSKKPLKRIDVVEADKSQDEYDSLHAGISPSNVEIKEKTMNTTENTNDLSKARLSFDVPKTLMQFLNCWKILRKNPEEAYLYLKKIPGSELPKIFENSLESDFFSDLITLLASEKIKKDPNVIYTFLLALTNVKRFRSLVLFMSAADHTCVTKCISELKTVKSEKEISELMRLYEL